MARLKQILLGGIILRYSRFTREICPRTTVSTVELQGAVAKAVDCSDAPCWPKLHKHIWSFSAGVAGVSETALHHHTS